MLFTPSLLFLFPALVPGFPHLNANQAVAMGLIVEFVGYSSSASGYILQKMVAFRPARSLLLITVPIAVSFGALSSGLSSQMLLGAFAFILFLLASILLWSKYWRTKSNIGDNPNMVSDYSRHVMKDGQEVRYRFRHEWLDSAVAATGGAFVGLVGIGIGEITATLLASRHRFPMRLVIGTSVFVVAVTVLSAAVVHVVAIRSHHVELPWNLVAVMILAVTIGGQIAPRIARHIPETIIFAGLVTAYVLIGSVVIVRVLFF